MRPIIPILMAVVVLCIILMVGFFSAVPIGKDQTLDIATSGNNRNGLVGLQLLAETPPTALGAGFVNASIETDPEIPDSTLGQVLNQTASSVTTSDGILYIATIDYPLNTTSGELDPQPSGGKGGSTLHAINTSTGTVVWKYTFDSMVGGDVSVIDNLVLMATANGRLFLFNKTTGSLLLEKMIASPSFPPSGDVEADFGLNTIARGTPNNTSSSSNPRYNPDFGKYATPAPNLSIQMPSAGERLPSGDLTISVEVLNFDLTDPRTVLESCVEGQGHLHYFLDCTPPTKTNCTSKLKAGEIVETINTSHTWENVTPGTHSLSVMLVNNDHMPLQPPVVKTVIVTVDEDSASEVEEDSASEVEENSVSGTDTTVLLVPETRAMAETVYPKRVFEFGNTTRGLRRRG